jgi:hypothetical protein
MRPSALCLPLLLAACGGGADPAPVPQPTPAEPSSFQNQVSALSKPEQNIVFVRAIRDADRTCQRVTDSSFVRMMPSGEQLYTARCQEGAVYGVLMGRTGEAKILSRS